MYLQKKQMREAAILYYEKNMTQNRVAEEMNISRQTVSKLLNEAVKENIVEIKINNPELNLTDLENEICTNFNIKKAIICGVSENNDDLCMTMVVKTAAKYILSIIKNGNLKIGISWGRTIQNLINEFDTLNMYEQNNKSSIINKNDIKRNDIKRNIVFPLFGATDQEQAFFSSNELARSFADKIGASVKCAWFPYKPDCINDCELFKKTSYYKNICDLWNNTDLSIVGIGNKDIINIFGETFGYNEQCVSAVGDIATHFFDSSGSFTSPYQDTLCASEKDLKRSKETIAVACGKAKTVALFGALRTGLIDTFITDEYTAKRILAYTK